MASSKIEITFNCDLEINEFINFEKKYDNGTLTSGWTSTLETWKTLRTSNNQVTKGTPTGIPGERSAINYAQALQMDFLFYYPQNGALVNGVQVIGNMVRVTHSVDWKFRTVAGGTPPCVSINVQNFNSPFFNIISTNYVTAVDNPVCSHYRVEVTTSELATDYTINGVQVTGNTENPITFEQLRGVGFVFSCANSNGQTANTGAISTAVPSLFSNSTINLQINSSPNGATVVATVFGSVFGAQNSYTYSLDGTTFQDSNTFSGLANGDYVMNVVDQFGCGQSVQFTVTDANVVNPFHYISESMSIRYAERITEGVCGPYKTDRQKLSCEEFAEDLTLVYPHLQKRNTCDSPTTQFLSNYQDLTATVIRENGDEENLNISQLTQNIGRKDSRDARKYNLGYGKTGVYFLTGNLYDFDTGVDTGEDYTLNGGLPEWGRIGYYININGAWFQIENIVFDESKNADVLVVDTIYTGFETNVIAKSIFNREVYEVYEFTTPMASYEGECIRVKIEHSDPNFQDVEYLSEIQEVKESHPGTVEIVSYNDKNTDVFYKTGIKQQVRAEIVAIKGDHDGDVDVLKSDTKVDLLSANLYQLEQFIFKPTSKGIYRQRLQILTQKFVFINGEAFVKNDKIEKNGPLGTSNQYQMTATMLRSNAQHSTQISGAETTLINPDDNLEVPNFIAPDTDEFISY